MTALFWIWFTISWLAIGGFLLANSQSRGLVADTIFVATWPIHVVLYLSGKDSL